MARWLKSPVPWQVPLVLVGAVVGGLLGLLPSLLLGPLRPYDQIHMVQRSLWLAILGALVGLGFDLARGSRSWR
jgi:hypothetical protein